MQGSSVEVLKGHAKVLDEHTLRVHPQQHTSHTVTAQAILFTVGSRARHLRGVPIDNKYVFDSDMIVTAGRTPKRILIQGAGIIGVEMAFIMRSFGADVKLIEYNSGILTQLDLTVTQAILSELASAGVQVHVNATVNVLQVPVNGNPMHQPMSVCIESNDGQSKFEWDCDTMLSCTGRIGNADSLGLDSIGITVDKSGRIPVRLHTRHALHSVV